MLTGKMIVEVVASLVRSRLEEIAHYLPQAAFDPRLAAERAALQGILRWCDAGFQDLEKALKDPDEVASPVVGAYCRHRDLDKEKLQ